MREIKFKFLLENGEVTEPYYLKELIDSDAYINIECEYGSKIKQELQYTGLKDKNGKDIYEGDIVECDGEIAKVTYENIIASFCVGGNSFNSSEAKYMKIIGNIYENPELLRED